MARLAATAAATLAATLLSASVGAQSTTTLPATWVDFGPGTGDRALATMTSVWDSVFYPSRPDTDAFHWPDGWMPLLGTARSVYMLGVSSMGYVEPPAWARSPRPRFRRRGSTLARELATARSRR